MSLVSSEEPQSDSCSDTSHDSHDSSNGACARVEFFKFKTSQCAVTLQKLLFQKRTLDCAGERCEDCSESCAANRSATTACEIFRNVTFRRENAQIEIPI